MNITVSKRAGFCFGVKRAVDLLDETIEKDSTVYTYGELIHNDQFLEKYKEKGVQLIDDLAVIDSGTVVIRSHGVSKDVYDLIEEKGLKMVDATCPYVLKIHKMVNEHYKKGYRIIIFGKDSHPEIQGINGWCNHDALILEDLDQPLDLNDKKNFVVFQTTYNLKRFEKVMTLLNQSKGDYEIQNTICSATENRQKEAMTIASHSDLMIVIGGKNSSNSNKLYEICKKICKNTIFIQTYEDLVMTKYKKCDNIGITAGASTPDWIIDKIINKINEGEGIIDGKQ